MKLIENKNFQIAFAVAVVLLLFVHNGSLSLWDQDEAAYAGFGYKMLQGDNFAIPEFTWSEIHRKTPFHFWAIAFSYKLFGVNEFAVRFPATIAILLTLLITYLFTAKVFDRQRGFLVFAVLATSFLVVALAKISMTDAGVLLCCTIAAVSLYYILNENSKSILWVILFWAANALGILQKGPPVFIFSLVFFVMLAVFHPQRIKLLKLHPWFFLPLSLLPLFLWAKQTYIQDGGTFISWFIDWYILKRIGGSVLGQSGPPGTHLLIMTLCFLPYFMFVPNAIWSALINLYRRKGNHEIFFGAWLVAGWLLYELSPSKLPAYVLAAHVPLAFLIAEKMDDFSKQISKPYFALSIVQYFLLFILCAALIAAPFFLNLDFYPKLLFTASGIALIAFLAISFQFGYKRKSILLMLLFALILQLVSWGILMPQVDKLKDATREVSLYLKTSLPANAAIIIANDFGRPPSLPFYLMQHFDNISELKEPEKILNAYNSSDNTAFILNKEQFEFLESSVPNLNYRNFSSFITDRKEKSDYYVLIKK